MRACARTSAVSGKVDFTYALLAKLALTASTERLLRPRYTTDRRRINAAQI